MWRLENELKIKIELQKYVQKISKSITVFTHSMKSMIDDRDDVKIITTKERDFASGLIASQKWIEYE